MVKLKKKKITLLVYILVINTQYVYKLHFFTTPKDMLDPCRARVKLGFYPALQHRIASGIVYQNDDECHHQIVILVKVVNDAAPCFPPFLHCITHEQPIRKVGFRSNFFGNYTEPQQEFVDSH